MSLMFLSKSKNGPESMSAAGVLVWNRPSLKAFQVIWIRKCVATRVLSLGQVLLELLVNEAPALTDGRGPCLKTTKVVSFVLTSAIFSHDII